MTTIASPFKVVQGIDPLIPKDLSKGKLNVDAKRRVKEI